MIFFFKSWSVKNVLQEVAQRSTVFRATARKGEDEEVEEEVAEPLDEEDIYREQVLSFRVCTVIFTEKVAI